MICQIRFVRSWFRAECMLCRALTRHQAVLKHAEWHALRGESMELDGGLHRAYLDVTVYPDADPHQTRWITQSTRWVTQSGGPP